MIAVLIILAAVVVVACPLLGFALVGLDREREAHAETRHELADKDTALARVTSELDLAQRYAIGADLRVDEIQHTAHRFAGERDEWQTKHDAIQHDIAEMRMRGRILPDLDDPLERLVFDDGGPSPIFDAMPGGVAIATLIGAGA